MWQSEQALTIALTLSCIYYDACTVAVFSSMLLVAKPNAVGSSKGPGCNSHLHHEWLRCLNPVLLLLWCNGGFCGWTWVVWLASGSSISTCSGSAPVFYRQEVIPAIHQSVTKGTQSTNHNQWLDLMPTLGRGTLSSLFPSLFHSLSYLWLFLIFPPFSFALPIFLLLSTLPFLPE